MGEMMLLLQRRHGGFKSDDSFAKPVDNVTHGPDGLPILDHGRHEVEVGEIADVGAASGDIRLGVGPPGGCVVVGGSGKLR